jgi:universal stress protein A
MDDVRTLLVPVDFATCAPHLVRQAARLARKLGSEVVLLHVIEPVPGVPGDVVVAHGGSPVAAGELLRTRSEQRMASFVALARAEGAPARSELVVGRATAGILAAADAVGAGMIVMDTHGRTGLQRMLLGSVAEQVVRRARVPVLTVRSHPYPECAAGACAGCAAHLPSEVREVEAEMEG